MPFLITSALTGGLLLFASPQSSAPAATNDSWSGTWQSPDNKSLEVTLERTGETIHVKEEEGGKVRVDYTCSLNAKDCEFREDGHKARVSLWENGPKLVEVRTRGSAVTRRRFVVVEDHSLQVEVMPMEPPGKAATTIVYVRQNKQSADAGH